MSAAFVRSIDLLDHIGGAELGEGVAGEDRVRGEHVDGGGAGFPQRAGARDERAARDDHVVAHHADLAAHLADDLADRGDVVSGAHLVHDRDIRVKHLRELRRHFGAARVGRHRDDAVTRDAEVAEVVGEERKGGHVVDRDLEEALDLAGVKVHGEDAVGTGDLQHVGDELRSDRLARRRLLVLARVRKPRDDRGDPARRGELCRVHHDQQLHQVAIDGLAAGLHDEEVGAADGVLVTAVRLAVGKGLDRRVTELDAERSGDVVGQVGVRTPGEEHQTLRRRPLEVVVRRRALGGDLLAGRLEAGEPLQLSHSAPHVRALPC